MWKPAAVFIQPTWFCALSCEGCYSYAAHADRPQMPLSNLSKIIESLVLGQDSIEPEQITLAVDVLPNSGNLLMASILKVYLDTITSLGAPRSRDFHITINSLHDLKAYKTQLPNLDIENKLTYASVSNLGPDAVTIARDLFGKRTKINWNVLAGAFLSANRKGNLESLLAQIDHTYLLVHKAPWGQNTPKSSYLDFLKAIEIAQQLPPKLKAKVTADNCMVASANWRRTGFGCSANVSRFHIWPDARVTGCPYSSEQYGEPFQWLENIKNARKRYEFRGCAIPRDLIAQPLGKSNSVRALPVVA